MSPVLKKIPFLLELFVNGSFILLFSMQKLGKLPLGMTEADAVLWLDRIAPLIPIVILAVVVASYLDIRSLENFFRRYIFSLVVLIPAFITWGDTQFAFWLSSAHLLSSILSLYDEDPRKKKVLEERERKRGFLLEFRLKPAQIVLLSFSGVILLGTFLLLLPVSAADGKVITFADALFISTSAVCVTGLSTISVGENFSVFGQLIVLGLIQIGGLSIMTLYASMTILLGRALAMKDRILMQDLHDASSLEDLFQVVIDIIKYTFAIELWGAIVLTIGFTFEGFEFGQALYQGFFHSISAFCNAGFSLFDNSLESFATNPLINFTIMALITLGGLGFIVLKELKSSLMKGFSFNRLGLHSRVVLVTSAILTGSAAVFIFFGEFLHSLDSYTLWDKIQIALFQSVTLRTAGFNTIPLTGLHTYTLYFMTLIMFIGGSPGSTAGGIKTTTLAILTQSIVATLKNKKKVEIFDRTISAPIVVRATAITFISIMITSLFILLMMKLEPDQNFLAIIFEVMSAGGTVGLSLGLTGFLSLYGKLAICVVMFIGRIGPLTLILAIGQQDKDPGKFDYPEGRIMIG